MMTVGWSMEVGVVRCSYFPMGGGVASFVVGGAHHDAHASVDGRESESLFMFSNGGLVCGGRCPPYLVGWLLAQSAHPTELAFASYL